MIDTAEMKEIVQSLLTSQRLAALSTQMSGRPYSNLIAFAATEDLKYIFFATSRATRKYANLTAEPWVSLLIDNRSNQEKDFDEASAVTVLGTAEEALDSDREKYLQLYLKKHPYLEEFVTAPTCALIRVKVEKFIMVTRFQEVREIYPGP
ncbi:MAG: pyridoxamine 5'-phosphate oxidase family protein [Deltaproteobacteria bacterium]|nr:pyridoxamine 5'-phosphate oxidase family protein [Deltaproteobacteria bacterium]